MAQIIFADIDPDVTSGTELAGYLNDFRDAIVSGFSGTSRPSGLDAGGYWIDTTDELTPTFLWRFKIYTGTTDVEVFTVNLNTGLPSIAGAESSFNVTKYSADSVGPLLEFVKRRVASNGQVTAGDVIGELRFVGRTNSPTDPVVATMKVIAIDTETTSASGAYIVWQSTPTGAAVAAEHMRLMNGFLGVGTQAPDSMVHALGASGIKSEYSADSANPAKISTQKSRVSGDGSTQNNDYIGEWDAISTDSTPSKVITAKVKIQAIEAHAPTARGTKFTLATISTGGTALSDKLDVGDKVETIVTLKKNSEELGEQDIATTATIAQMSATKCLVEMTGSTATSIQGINSGQASKVITIHNRSSADVTLKHQDAGAAAADRLLLPNSADAVIPTQSSAEVYYCVTDSRWKIKSSAGGLNSPSANSVVEAVAAGATKTLSSADNGKIFLCDTSTAVVTINAHAAAANFSFVIKDKAGNASAFAITLVRNGSQKIELLSTNYIMEANGGCWKFVFDGTDWFKI